MLIFKSGSKVKQTLIAYDGRPLLSLLQCDSGSLKEHVVEVHPFKAV